MLVSLVIGCFDWKMAFFKKYLQGFIISTILKSFRKNFSERALSFIKK